MSKESCRILYTAIGSLIGLFFMVALSSIQKIQIGVPIEIKGFIVPSLVGSVVGYFLTFWNLKVRFHSIELKEEVVKRTYELQEMNNLLENSNKRYLQMFENMSSGVSVFKTQNNGENFVFVDFNSAAERIEDISRENVLGKEVRDVFPGIKEFGLFDVLKRVYKTGQAEHYSAGEYKDDRIKGWRENYVYKLLDGELVAIYEDVTERKQLEAKLHNLANRDSLTNTYNRRVFMEKLSQEFKRTIRYNHPLSLMMMDIDFFKRVNDQFGHEAGDIVLKNICRMGKNGIRDIDILGRVGGEEFAFLLPNTKLHEAIDVGERIRLTIETSETKTHSETISVTVSIGISEVTQDTEDVQELMRMADSALYAAKDRGRNLVIAFESEGTQK